MSNYTPPPPELSPGSTVWAYLRDSGGPTQDRSVSQQRDVLEAYCQRRGLTLTLVGFKGVNTATSTPQTTTRPGCFPLLVAA